MNSDRFFPVSLQQACELSIWLPSTSTTNDTELASSLRCSMNLNGSADKIVIKKYDTP